MARSEYKGERDTLHTRLHRMLYASSKDALKKRLKGIVEEFQATDRGDLIEGDLLEKAGHQKG